MTSSTAMMIPERLGTAAMTIGSARAALDVATAYTTRRKAFGQVINQFQGVSFQVAEAAMLLDACRAMANMTARAVDAGANVKPSSAGSSPSRRSSSPSPARRPSTTPCRSWAASATRTSSPSNGSSATSAWPRSGRYQRVMSLIAAHELVPEYFERKGKLPATTRLDAAEADAADEKVYDDEDMWKKGWEWKASRLRCRVKKGQRPWSCPRKSTEPDVPCKGDPCTYGDAGIVMTPELLTDPSCLPVGRAVWESAIEPVARVRLHVPTVMLGDFW